ncbi:hypothetical protein V6N13_083688 [Hibiscus sabdariffa]
MSHRKQQAYQVHAAAVLNQKMASRVVVFVEMVDNGEGAEWTWTIGFSFPRMSLSSGPIEIIFLSFMTGQLMIIFLRS